LSSDQKDKVAQGSSLVPLKHNEHAREWQQVDSMGEWMKHATTCCNLAKRSWVN